MNRIIYSLIFFSFTVLAVNAQNSETLITIGKTKVSLDEFKRIYKKNNSNLYNETDKKSPAEYLELYLNYKLKVIEAQNMKLDTSAAFINELAGYRKELAAPYLTDVNFKQEMVEKMYDRMTKEVNASHILFRFEKNATSEDEQTVYEKILNLKQEILAGKDFNDAARDYSEDPSAKTNGGKLEYFSAFQMVAPFEDAAFSTPVGEISEPVKSSFGYHLIKVHDIRKNRGEIKVAHIMKMFPQSGVNQEIKNHLKSEIDSIYIQLTEGADFAEMAKKYSDDNNSRTEGGEMPWFSSGRMIPEFSIPAFALENIGDYTKPVETSYGYHIIKKLDEKNIALFEELKEDIENRIKKDPERSITSKKAFINKLKTEYNFKENKNNIGDLKKLKIGNDFSNQSMVLFTIDNKEYNFSKLQSYLKENKIQNSNYYEYFEEWVEYEITKLEDSKLEEKYDDFKYLMQEYHDGILLFNISEDKIWNYAAKDSSGLKKFHKKNKGKYLWDERFKGYVVICNSVEIREEAEKYFASEMTGDEISDLMNQDKNKITITEGAWEKGVNPIVDYFVWNGPEPQYFVGKHTFIRGDKINPEPKNLDESRGLYISDYQNYLEKKWIKKLRRKYKIKVNKELLNSIQNEL